MARGLKKHLKRLNAPKHWMLNKLGGAFAPKPSSGPHKSRECLPLILILRIRLKYALNYREVISILMQRHVLVDGKVRIDNTYPAGFMDVHSTVSPCLITMISVASGAMELEFESLSAMEGSGDPISGFWRRRTKLDVSFHISQEPMRHLSPADSRRGSDITYFR
uniref:Small ribosomal subunit protein eS4 N-terminal domain-containing protein n=1 Tax=Kalanchoe fedtschenkoi TaxID=63787 RepID=A0A7N0TPS7_KALFE